MEIKKELIEALKPFKVQRIGSSLFSEKFKDIDLCVECKDNSTHYSEICKAIESAFGGKELIFNEDYAIPFDWGGRTYARIMCDDIYDIFLVCPDTFNIISDVYNTIRKMDPWVIEGIKEHKSFRVNLFVSLAEVHPMSSYEAKDDVTTLDFAALDFEVF